MIGKARLLASTLAIGVPMAGCAQTDTDTVPSEVLDRLDKQEQLVSGFIDKNGNGTVDEGEQIFTTNAHRRAPATVTTPRRLSGAPNSAAGRPGRGSGG